MRRKVSKDNFGDRIKVYEGIETNQSFIPLLPIIVRLDGRSFSSYTSNMNRPYDLNMVNAMVGTTKALVEETGAVVGYTQSDEITLVLYSPRFDSQIWFDGKKLKIISCLASLCAVEFYKRIVKQIPEKAYSTPTFDCRAFNVPSKVEAANCVLWRELDAFKNAVSSAARYYYSHKELDGKTGNEKQEMLFAKGINFNDYPAFFKRGTFVQKRRSIRKFTPAELAVLPPKHNGRVNPDLEIERTDVIEVDMPSFSKVTNRVEVVFDGATPIVKNEG
jgi:tRNA(His) 5'-end guanylyltransferase